MPNNPLLRGERFENTEAGVADFDVFSEKEDSYRLEVRTDDLPELGPHRPEPYLFSEVFRNELGSAVATRTSYFAIGRVRHRTTPHQFPEGEGCTSHPWL